jgi:hypothetical protein
VREALIAKWDEEALCVSRIRGIDVYEYKFVKADFRHSARSPKTPKISA